MTAVRSLRLADPGGRHRCHSEEIWRSVIGFTASFHAGCTSGRMTLCGDKLSFSMKIAAGLLCFQLLTAQPVGRSGDEAAVRAMVKRYADARDASDPKAIATLFTDDAD